MSSANTAANTASPESQVALDLDAGSLSLLPDADLHLDPLPTLDPDALYRDSLDAGDGASAPDAGPGTASSAP